MVLYVALVDILDSSSQLLYIQLQKDLSVRVEQKKCLSIFLLEFLGVHFSILSSYITNDESFWRSCSF